jgi:hypothetical protein
LWLSSFKLNFNYLRKDLIVTKMEINIYEVGVIIFSLVRFLSKKVTKPKLFFFEKKNWNQTETGSNRPVSVRFGFLGQKPVQTGLARFSWFWLGFLGFGSVFRFGSVFFRFFVGFGSVWFFQFFGYKTETEPAGFFKNLISLIGFFFRFGFFSYFFLIFSI